jgi:predicted ATPase
MAYPEALIDQCDAEGMRPIAYEDTEHYQVMRGFLMHPQRMLDTLLER